jgi:YVTN family beta-propeller protein
MAPNTTDEAPDKRRKKGLLFLPLLGIPLLVGGGVATVAMVNASQDTAVSSSAAGSAKQSEGTDAPRLAPGGLGDIPLPLAPGEPNGPIGDGGMLPPVLGGGTDGQTIDAPSDSRTDEGGKGSPTGDSPATGGQGNAATGGSGSGSGSTPPPSTGTPSPGPTKTPAPGGTPTPAPTTTPIPGGTPTPSPTPDIGGSAAESAQGLPTAIREYGYAALMHVTGKFDLTGAKWSVQQGELPVGLAIDENTGAINGITTGSEGRYSFQLKVVAASGSLTGWFFIEVLPAPNGGDGTGGSGPSTPGDGTKPGDGGTTEPGGTPGDGSTEQPGGSTGGDGSTDPNQPGQGGDNGSGDGGSGQAPDENGGSGTPGSGDGGTDGGSEPSPTPDPGTGTETPTPGDGSTSDPDDPSQIDPGSGGSQTDVLAFDVPEKLPVTVSGRIDQDLAATSSLGLAISYSASGLPSWLSFVDGHLAGDAPDVEGAFNVTLTAIDDKHTIARQLTISVNPDVIQVDAAGLSLSQGATGTLELHATNGASNASFTFTVTDPASGAVSIDGTTLTASFAQPGSFQVSVLVRDVNSPNSASKTIIIPVEVTPTPIAFEAGGLNATQYVAFTGQLSATGGWGRYTYKVVDGTLPPGLKLDGSGSITGTASTAGSYTATVQVADYKGLVAQSTLTVTVATNPAISPATTIQVATAPVDEAFSSDGSKLYVVSSLGKTLSVIDRATSTVTGIIPLTVYPNGVAASADGRYVAVSYATGTQVFDVATNALVTTILGTNPLDVSWSSDSSQLFVLRGASSAAQFDIIDASTWTLEKTIKVGATTSNWRLTELPNGHVLANSGYSATVYEIDPVAGTATANFSNGAQGIGAVASSGDGTAWVVGSTMLRHIDLTTKKQITQTDLGSGVSVVGTALSPDGQWLYLLTTSGTVIVFDTQANTVNARVPVDASTGGKLVVSADGRVYTTSGSSKTVVTVLAPSF